MGLLQEGEQSGYDLQRRIQRGVGYFWAPTKTRLYAALPKLVERGFAVRRDVPQSGKPDKQLYRLTTEGGHALRAWLDSGPVEAPPDRNPILLKLFFGDSADPEALVRQLAERRAAGERLLEELAEIEKWASERDDDFYPSLTRRWGYEYATALVRWAEEAEAAIRRIASVRR